MSLTLEGAFTALVTPFLHGEVDLNALAGLVEFQIADGIAGLVPVGTTGESPTLTAVEAREVIATTIRVTRKRVPVIAGTGSNSTAETIARTRVAQELGADAAMIVMPYYNKPTQRGLAAHVKAVHDATDIPLVLYNVPTRGTADLAAETVLEIARACPRVIAVKEATGNILRAQHIHALCGDRVTVLCGDDALTVGMMAVGAKGVISVASNVLPGAVAGVCRAMLKHDYAEARRRQNALLPLYDAMFVETNPGPVKAALAVMGRIAPEIRLPMAWATEGTVQKVTAALRDAGVDV